MTPIERAALAVLPHIVEPNDNASDLTDEAAARFARTFDIVRTVMNALREPTDHMLDFGAEAHDSGSRGNAADIWVAMMDAASTETIPPE